MSAETIHFDNARVVQQLIGNSHRNLQVIETDFGVKATSREGWIKLEGPARTVDELKDLFLTLDNSVKSGVTIRSRDFAYALQVLKQDGLPAVRELFDQRSSIQTRKALITPKTLGQKTYVETIRNHDVTLGIGPAGTGKTYMAMAMAVSALREEQVARIILTRPAVEAGEALGFLPGDLQEKLAPYLRPLHDALYDMMPGEEIQKNMDRSTIEIAPLAYMRGRTLNRAFIILDEAQNATTEQMFMFLTRLGFGSKAVITGDITQIDLPPNRRSGLVEAQQIIKGVAGVGVVEFQRRDVVRHPLVQRIIHAYEQRRNPTA